jgi:hypothetical protein
MVCGTVSSPHATLSLVARLSEVRAQRVWQFRVRRRRRACILQREKKMRLAAYGALSTSLATAVVLAAFQQRPNFYSACVYLSQSNACLMILTNMGVFLTILFGFTVQKILFGHLRAIEEAHLRERTWFAVTETFLAMTVFRDEFNTRFVVMFVSLLFVKCFHWICQDRIDYVCLPPTSELTCV